MTHPFEGLTPDCVVDCVEAIGLRSDLRLLALNSYENRVYQVGIEDADPVIVKFYRPGRWTRAQILEEHTSRENWSITVSPLLHRWKLAARHCRRRRVF
jgi:Ser/Thr protein kinase RdoA (MazF antagonist)